MMMKHVFSFVLLGLGAAALGGCPIYSDDDRSNRVCVGSDCYSCPDPYISNNCYGFSCYGDTDCPSGYSCASNHRCKLTDGVPPSPTGTSCTKPSDCPSGSSCGADNKCHTGDCSTSGCPSTFVCKLARTAPRPARRSSATPAARRPAARTTATARPLAGSKCLSGTCVRTPPISARTPRSARPARSASQGAVHALLQHQPSPAPPGTPATTRRASARATRPRAPARAQCNGGNVCVQEHCVAPCGAGATCPSGLVCIDGGCTPDEQPVFTCATDGVAGQVPGGQPLPPPQLLHLVRQQTAVPDSCKSADQFNVCKSVTTSSGPHSVCGSTTNLGTDCDPTQAKNCASPLVCIDGFCR